MGWLSCIGRPRAAEGAEEVVRRASSRGAAAGPRPVANPDDTVVPVRDLKPVVDRMAPLVRRLGESIKRHGLASPETVRHAFRVSDALPPHGATEPSEGTGVVRHLFGGRASAEAPIAAPPSDPPLKRAAASGQVSDVHRAFYD